MIDERVRVCREAAFAVFDVTQPLSLPADVVYARLLLGHLADPRRGARDLGDRRSGPAALARVRRTGALPQRRRVLRALRGRRSPRSSPRPARTLWAESARSTTIRPRRERALDRVVEHPVPAARAAAMFWRNAVQWQDRAADADALIEHLRRREQAGDTEIVTWEIASGRLQEAPRVIPAFFSTSGGTPNSRHAP